MPLVSYVLQWTKLSSGDRFASDTPPTNLRYQDVFQVNVYAMTGGDAYHCPTIR